MSILILIFVAVTGMLVLLAGKAGPTRSVAQVLHDAEQARRTKGVR